MKIKNESVLRSIVKIPLWILCHSPLYPFWLYDLKSKIGNEQILDGICGRVLEVGAGSGQRKEELMQKNKNITEYVVTDCSDWDEVFDNYSKLSQKSNFLCRER